MTDDKVLEKLQKIKAHADSAKKIGSLEEAEAFAQMLQRLLLKHKLELTDIELEQEEKDEPVEASEIDWEDIKVRSTRIAWIEQLAIIIAKAHFCRVLVHPGSSQITLVGRRTDSSVAEYMIVTLTRAADRLARAERRAYRREVFRRDGTKDAAAGFKAAFLKSFINRLAERYEAEKRAQTATSSTALVRFNRADSAVRDWFSGHRTKRASIVRGSRHDHNAEGHRRGAAAADRINLRANGVGTTPTRGELS